MTSLYLHSVLSAVGIGVVIALLTAALRPRNLSPAWGTALVFVLCAVYHILAAYSMNYPGLEIIGWTVAVPLLFSFDGLGPFIIAFSIQVGIAGFVGMVLYLIFIKLK